MDNEPDIIPKKAFWALSIFLVLANGLFMYVNYELNFPKSIDEGATPNVNCLNISSYSTCQLKISAESTQQINNTFSDPKTRFVRLNPIVRPYNNDESWRVKNRSDEIGIYSWVWADGGVGRRFLSLEYSFVEMSLWTLSPGVKTINIDLHDVQQGCWVTLNVTEQFCILTSLFLDTVHEQAVKQHHLQDSFFCYDMLYLSVYQCSNVSNVLNFKFSLETNRLAKVNILKFIIIYISFYFLPFFFVLLIPELITVRYSPQLLGNMGNFEINYSTARTPLDDSLTLRNQNYVVVAVFCFYDILLNIPLFYGISIYCINLQNQVETQMEVPLISLVLIVLFLLFLLILFVFSWFMVWIFELVLDYEVYKKTANNIANIKSDFFQCELGFQSTGPNIDCAISSYLGEYISLENNVRRNWLEVPELIKGWAQFIFKCRCTPLQKKYPAKCLLLAKIIMTFIIGLSTIFVLTSPLCCVLIEGMIMTKEPYTDYNGTQISLLILTMLITYILFFLSCLSLSFLIKIVTMTLAGAIINYEIVLPYLIFGLSVLYYVWSPFHDLQEKYRVLKTIVFKECSSSGLKYIKHISVNDQSTNGSDSHVMPHTEETYNGEEESAEYIHLTGTNDPRPQHSSRLALLYSHSDEEGIAYSGSEQALPPPLEQANTQAAEYVILYKSDEKGWERIPKDLWESIYKELLPLNTGITKSFIKCIVAVTMTAFFLFTLSDFDSSWELQFIGQGIASLITVSIPRLVLGFINTDASKDSLKRSWEVAVKEKVKQYIEAHEIPHPWSVD